MNTDISTIQALAKNFTDKELRPRFSELDSSAEETLALLFKILGDIRFFSMLIPEKNGGAGMDISACRTFISEISRVCPALGVILASHHMALSFIQLLGTVKMKPKIMSEIVESENKGEIPILTLGWMEDSIRLGQGLMLHDMDTLILKKGNNYILKGEKIYVPAANIASKLVILAKTESDKLALICIPTTTKGLQLKPSKPLMGLRSCPFNPVIFENITLSSENILKQTLIQEDVLTAFTYCDTFLGAIGLGMANEAHSKAHTYATERYQGGKIISEHDAIRDILFNMSFDIEKAKRFGWQGDPPENTKDMGNYHILSSVASAETAVKIALNAIQVLGGYGYMKDYGVERILRDAKTFQNTVVIPRCRQMEYLNEAFEEL